MRPFLALSFCLLAGIAALHAQLQPAAVSHDLQPGVRSSSNGTPVIDITAPDQHGVSRNDFEAFNVGQKGAILNNSFLPGHDALGGVVKHNPNLGWGDYAGLILNEVLGTSPSRLNGPLKVFGPRAEVVIANPNGISANGAEFYNISRLTLAAGTAQYDGRGNLGLSVDAGKLEIGSGGLRVLGVEDVTLLGRNLLLNGPLEAGNLLSLFAGQRTFDYKTRTSKGTGTKGKGWGVDSNALGGVSAGRIILESTDKGVGVRAPRRMAASAGDVTITANGRIRLGQVRSNGRISVRSNGGSVVQRGNSVATGAIAYQATGKIDERGAISSGSDVALQSHDFANEGSIASNGAIWIDVAGSVFNAGTIQGDQGVVAHAGLLRNAGQIASAGTVELQTAQGLANTGTILGTQGVALVNQAGDLTQGGRVESALGPLSEQSGGNLADTGTLLARQDVALQAGGDLLTAGGTIVAGGSVSLSGQGELTLGNIQSGGRLTAQSAAGNLIQSGNVTADGRIAYGAAGKIDLQGSLSSGSYLQFQSGDWSNEGSALTNGAVLIAASGDAANAGRIEGDQGVQVQSATLSNAGEILSADAIVLQTGSGLSNTGPILGNQGVALMNQAGVLAQAGSVGSSEGNLLELSGGSLLHSGSSLASGRAILRSEGDLTASGTVIANGGLNLIGNGQVSLGGTISTQGDLVAAASGSLDNRGTLTVGGILQMSAGEALSSTQPLNAGGNLYVDAKSVTLEGGAVSGAGLQIIASAGNLLAGGILSAVQNLILEASGDVATRTTVTSGGDLGIEAGGSVTAGQKWAAGGDLALIAGGALVQREGFSAAKAALQAGGNAELGGRIASDGSVGLWVGGNLTNHAAMAANGDIGLNVAGNLTNTGSLQAGGTIALTGGARLDNAGAITAGGQARLVSQEALTNRGAVGSNDGILLQTVDGNLTNQGGLKSLKDIVVSSGAALDNAGPLASRADVELAAATSLTNGGAAQVTGVLSLLSQGDLANTAHLVADGGLQLVSDQGSLQNRGKLESEAGLQLSAGADLSNAGDLVTGGDLLLHAGNDLTSSGALSAGGKADLAAGRDLALSATMVAGDDVQAVAGGTVTTAGSIQSNAGIALQAGGVLTNQANLSARSDVALVAAGTFTNGAATAGAAEPVIVAGHNAGVSAGGAAANHGTIEADNILQVEAGSLNNDGGALRSAGDLVITAGAGGSGSGAVSNADGTIQAGRNLNLALNDFSGPGGTVQSGWDAVISAGNWDNDGAQLLAGRSLQLSLTSGSNRGGTMQAGTAGPGDLLLTGTGAFDNAGGTLQASRHVLLQTGAFDNTNGRITASSGDLAWTVKGALDNAGGSVQAGHNLAVSVQGDLNDAGGRFNATGDSQYAVGGALDNRNGSIGTGNNLALEAASLDNRQGAISAGTDVAGLNVAHDADNTGGTLAAGGVFQGQVGGTFTQGGSLTGNAQVQLEVNDLQNSGRIASAGQVVIAAGTLDNQAGGTLQGDLGVALQATNAAFALGSTIESYAGPVEIAVGGALTNQGTITTNQDLTLQAGGAFTNQGDLVAGNDLRLMAAGQIDNQQLISAGHDLWVSAADANGNLYPILNQGGSFLAGHDARFDTSFFTNTTRGGLATDTGWQHVAVLYPDGTGTGKGLPGGVSPPNHYYGQLTLELGYVDTRTFAGPAAVVSAGHDLLINSSGGGLNQASTIVAGNTVTLLGSWENQSEGTYYGQNWLLVYQAADRHNGDNDSLDGNDRYRPSGVASGDTNAETDAVVVGEGWNFGSGLWQYVESPYFAWNPQKAGPSQSPWTFKDALFPGQIDGRDAHDFFGVADSLQLKFVITSTLPGGDAKHLKLQDQPGRQGVIDGLAGTNVALKDDDFGEPIGANGRVVAAADSTATASGLGPAAEPHANPPPGALPSVPDLASAVAQAPAWLPAAITPATPAQASPTISARSIPRGNLVTATAPVTAVPASPVIATIGAVSAVPTSIPTIPRVSAQGAIRADVRRVIGSDPAYRIVLDASPEVHFPDFDSYWVNPTHAAIELSPELKALLARDPIPDRSPIKALDHLLGKAFTQSSLLAWAHGLKPAVSATDPGRSIVANVQGVALPSGYASRAQWLAALQASNLAANSKGLFTTQSLFANLAGSAPQGVSFQSTLGRPDFGQMVQAHQAWLAKNDPGFYGWQDKVQKAVQKQVKAEESDSGVLSIIGIVAAVVITVVLTAVSYGWFAPVGANILGALTGAGAAAFTAGTATMAGAVGLASIVGGFVVTTGIGFAAGFMGTLIGTGGDLGQAFQSGLIGFAVAGVTFGVLHLPVLQDFVNTLASSLQGATAFAKDAQGFISDFVKGLVQKAAADATTLGLDKLFYGQAVSGASFLQGLGLFALTALAAFAIGHTPLLEQFWTDPATQVATFSQGSDQTNITLTGDLLKPVVEGAAAYGLGELLGVKDAAALGLGTAVGSFAAPWITAGVDALYGGQSPEGVPLYLSGRPTQYGSLALNLGAQIDGLVGGLAGYAYDGNFSLGQFGATQVYDFNDYFRGKEKADGEGRATWGMPLFGGTEVEFGTITPEGWTILDPDIQATSGLYKIQTAALDQFIDNIGAYDAAVPNAADARDYVGLALGEYAQGVAAQSDHGLDLRSGAAERQGLVEGAAQKLLLAATEGLVGNGGTGLFTGESVVSVSQAQEEGLLPLAGTQPTQPATVETTTADAANTTRSLTLAAQAEPAGVPPVANAPSSGAGTLTVEAATADTEESTLGAAGGNAATVTARQGPAQEAPPPANTTDATGATSTVPPQAAGAAPETPVSGGMGPSAQEFVASVPATQTSSLPPTGTQQVQALAAEGMTADVGNTVRTITPSAQAEPAGVQPIPSSAPPQAAEETTTRTGNTTLAQTPSGDPNVTYVAPNSNSTQSPATIGASTQGTVSGGTDSVNVLAHGLRHIAAEDQPAVIQAIKDDIATQGAPALEKTIQRTISANGRQFTYRAFGLPGGKTSVGTVIEGTFQRNIAQ